jgi:hypothetical protein
VAHAGRIVFRQGCGWSDHDAGVAITPDTVMAAIYNSLPLGPEAIPAGFESLRAKTRKDVEAEIRKAIASAPGA